MEGGVAHGFNAATPFAGVFPLNVLVALPNISGKKKIINLKTRENEVVLKSIYFLIILII